MATVLPDVLPSGCQVVFCGTQAGKTSAQIRAYYAGPGNKFWRTLAITGLTSEVIQARDYQRVAEFGIGLTYLVQMTAGPDAALRVEHWDVQGFWRRIVSAKPAIVAFNGKRAASIGLATPSTALSFGRALATPGNLHVHILPSTSGAAAGHWSVAPWHDLAADVRALG